MNFDNAVFRAWMTILEDNPGDRITCMRLGRIAESGTPSILFELSNKRRELMVFPQEDILSQMEAFSAWLHRAKTTVFLLKTAESIDEVLGNRVFTVDDEGHLQMRAPLPSSSQ